MNEKQFGLTPDNRPAHLYTIENEHFIVTMTDYGATIVNFICKDAGGAAPAEKGVDIVLGFADVSGYISEVPYMGSTVGRVCNRIAKGQYTLNSQTYQLPLNNHGNTLHGGTVGFSQKLWTLTSYKPEALVFEMKSADGEQGFNGAVTVEAEYRLQDDGLLFTYKAVSDADTICAITNHSYFNLNGRSSATILDHYLSSPADRIVAVDSVGLATDRIIPVSDTPFDFTGGKLIGRDIDAADEQIGFGHGYDHHFMVPGSGLREMAVCSCGELTLTVLSDLPGFQMYTANGLKGLSANPAQPAYQRRSGVCFETQFCPNVINTRIDVMPVLKAGQPVCHQTVYRVAVGGR